MVSLLAAKSLGGHPLEVQPESLPSVPPSLLATALVLQACEGVSDEEAKQRVDYDLRWKVALGVEVEARPLPASRNRPKGSLTRSRWRSLSFTAIPQQRAAMRGHTPWTAQRRGVT